MSTVQWPDDFDWGATRAINKPVSIPEKAHEEKFDPDSNNKQADGSIKGASDAGGSYDNKEDELDSAALNKAFEFAAASSVTLVSF